MSPTTADDKILSRIFSLVAGTDNLVQGLKRHWLLRGIFGKMNMTNAVLVKAQPAKPVVPAN